jgi:hypothetical protein
MKIANDDLRKRDEEIARAAYKKEVQATNTSEMKAQKMKEEHQRMKEYFETMVNC